MPVLQQSVRFACVCKFICLYWWIEGLRVQLQLLALKGLIDIDLISVSDSLFYLCLMGLFYLVLIGFLLAVVGFQSSSPVTLSNLSDWLGGYCCI